MDRARDERGSAVVDFVLVMLVLVPLVLGVMQVALVPARRPAILTETPALERLWRKSLTVEGAMEYPTGSS